MNKYTSVLSLVLLTAYTTILGLTLREIREYEYQFLQKILDGCTMVVKPPRVYTPEELFFLSEGRYCPDTNRQTTAHNSSERIFSLEIKNDQLSCDNAVFKSPYADDNAHATIQWNRDNQTHLMPYGFDTTSSPSHHQCYFVIQQKPATEPSRCIQQQIHHARNSVVQRMQLFERMQHYNGVDFLNFIFGTSFTDHTPDQEIKDFIYDHTQQLLTNYALYPSPRYHQFLYHEVPGYRQHLQQIYDAMRSSHKTWHQLRPAGITDAWFKKHIERVHDHYNGLPEMDHGSSLQQWKFAKQLNEIVRNHTIGQTQAQTLLDDYHSMFDEFQTEDADHGCDTEVVDRYQQRVLALEKTYNGPLSVSYHQYALSSAVQQLLTANQLNPADFTACFGSAFAQQVHQELLSVLEQTAENQRLYNNPDSQQWSNIIAQHADIACTYNKTGNVTQATQWTDTCWHLLNYAQAIGQGVFEGTITGACFAAVATLAPLVNEALFTGTCAYIGGKTVWTLAELAGAYYQGGPKAVRAQLQQYKKGCQAALAHISQQLEHLSGPEKIHAVTAFATEVAVTPKILTLAQSVRKLELQEIKVLLSKVKNKAKNLQIADLLYKVADPTPQHGYLQLPGPTKLIPTSTNIVPISHPSHITNRTIQYPWLVADLDQTIIKLQDQPFILKEYAGNTPKKMKLYLMPLGRDEEIATAVKQIGGKLNLPIQMQQALNLQHLTVGEQCIAHTISIELVHEPKIGTYFGGYHYDPGEKLRNTGVISLQVIQKNSINNLVTAKTQLVNGGRIQDKSFFHSHWSLEEIIKKSQEALQNTSQYPILKHGRYIMESKTNCGITIRFAFDVTGHLVTFFPVS